MPTTPIDSPEGLKLLADAWEKSQAMLIDATKQGALVAIVVLGFLAAIVRNQPTGISTWALGCAVCSALSVLAGAAAIAANAREQQLRLDALTSRGEVFSHPRGLLTTLRLMFSLQQPTGQRPASSALEGLQFLTHKRALAVQLVLIQVALLAAAIISFAINIILILSTTSPRIV